MALSLSARTGMVLSFVFLVLSFLYISLGKKLQILFYMAIAALISLYFIANNISSFPLSLQKFFILIETLITNPDDVNSVTILFRSMLYMPDTNYLIGSGDFGRSFKGDYILSDIGYVRAFTGAGVIGVFFILFMPLYLFYKRKKLSFSDRYINYGLLISLLLVNFKLLIGVHYVFMIPLFYVLMRIRNEN